MKSKVFKLGAEYKGRITERKEFCTDFKETAKILWRKHLFAYNICINGTLAEDPFSEWTFTENFCKNMEFHGRRTKIVIPKGMGKNAGAG